ncbi:TetR/AcrR family transcriptional regulator C-terminal domain-containing protein [Solirubrobacter taibaiensis]|nr:TetR/AcrR family transcriptional regulator C-terminal domain-containing protein [Solirubrobacter taibaiensis]
MARPPKPILSRRGIAEEALRLVDEEGVDALTTRRLAKRLGVEGPSLYNHIAGRDDLLDEITSLIDEYLEAITFADDWRTGLAEFARAYRRAFNVQPQLVAIIASRPVRSPVALRAYDKAFAAFAGYGWSPEFAATVMAAIDYLVLGSAIETFKGGFDRPAAEYADAHPHLAAALAATEVVDVDDLGFELGLAALIAKVEADTTPR